MTTRVYRCTLALRNLNLFISTPPTTDHHKLRTQIISTRLFLLALFVSFTILVIYTSAVTVTKSIIIPSPSLDRYQQLYKDHSQTLACACSKISQTYQTFIDLNFTAHQVCYSSFITDQWIDDLQNTRNTGYMVIDDFRATAVFQFQALQSLCQLTSDMISMGLSRFSTTEYVTMDVTPLSAFTSQTDSFINQFISTTVKDFSLSFRIVRDTIHANGLISAAQTNTRFRIDSTGSDLFNVWNGYGDCDCARSSECHDQSAVFKGSSWEMLFLVPGFKVGCYHVESLLQSSLECFYDRTCFDMLSHFANVEQSSDVMVMNGSLMSRFAKTSTVGELLAEMMVERWDRSVVYEQYYSGCRPNECIYTLETRNDAIYIITTVIGLIGGITTILKVLVPGLIRFIRRRKTSTNEETGKLVLLV